MVFIAEAFGGWLVSQVADAGRRRLSEWLLGTDQERALQQAATAAIQGTARELRPGHRRADDMRGADHLARVIDQVFQRTPTPMESLPGHATLLQGLKTGLGARLAILGDEYITGTGQSSAELLGISIPVIQELLTHRLLGEMLARGASGGPLAPLADQLNHDLTHLQGQQHSADLAGLAEVVQSALATMERLDQARSLPAKATRPLVGRAVHELIDPFALEVHRAIDAPSGTSPLPALPTYVKRAHDRRLRAIIKRAASGRSAAAVLVGSSSTGKTRACWEAVQALPGEWQLWHPVDPSRPEAAADALPAVKPRTVIWLNDAQHYLLTPANGLGERVAAGLRELLRDFARSPVLVLGTIWPEYWTTLTSQPADEPDLHAQARALLTGIDIPVPEVFSGSAVYALQTAAKADPRLAEAASRAEDGRITQFLAGGPALLERYRNAPAPAKSLIEAAMDARRLGHSLFLPHSLLEAAASGYLTDQEGDGFGEDWLEQALAYCAAPCRGARGPLSRVRARPVPAQPHYRLADYLEQAGRARRQTVLAPAALWDALVVYADRRDLVRIAKGAERRSLYHHALQLYQRAADDGDRDALRQATELLERAGRTDEAVDWLQDAATTGHTFAMRRAAELLERTGRTDEAISLYQRAAEGGDDDALRRAVGLLEETGRIDEAIDWLTTRAVETSGRFALQRAGGLLERAGRTDEAISLYQRAAEGGDSYARGRAAGLMKRTGRTDQAIVLSKTRAEKTGDLDVLRRAAELLEKVGRRDDAKDSLPTGTKEIGGLIATRRAAEKLQKAGHIEDAISLYQHAAESGDPFALGQAVELLEKADRTDDAIDWLTVHADETGDRFAMRRAAELLKKAGRLDEAIDWLRIHADETGDLDALRRAAELLEKAGRLDDATGFYLHAAETGDSYALEQAAALLEKVGRSQEAAHLRQYGLEPGSVIATKLVI
jgi:tetratricopeptide (TPR) repeat protein